MSDWISTFDKNKILIRFINKSRLLFLLFLFASSIPPLFAQNGNFKIIGKLTDETGKTLVNASIIDMSNAKGTTTNEEGAFIISVDKFPVMLEISHLGYEKKIFRINYEEFKYNESFFEFELITKTYPLEEVEITVTNEKNVFSSTHKNIVLDYKVGPEEIILLLKKGNKRVLHIVDKLLNTWYEKKLKVKANSIFEDCQGNFHLITNDSVYQFVSNSTDSSLFIYPAYSLIKFEATLSICVGYINNIYVFAKLDRHNQQILYWSVYGHEKRTIHHVFDNERYLFAQNLIDRKDELIAEYGYFDDMGEISVSQLHIIDNITI